MERNPLPSGEPGPRRRAAALPAWDARRPDIHELLAAADFVAMELLPRGSNATFLSHLTAGESGDSLAVYKPRRGEAPLHDFPDGTLYQRERAAYLVSRALGWPDIPPTIVRSGPRGIGTVQLFIDHNPAANYFTFGPEHEAQLRQIALFDVIANNADRKGGHCLEDRSGRIWSIDHGLTFHAQYKLRTVIWDFRGDAIPGDLAADLEALARRLGNPGDDLTLALRELIANAELRACAQRISGVLARGVFPDYGPYRNTPWPQI